MKIVRPVVNTVAEVGHGVRDLARLRTVMGVMIRHGLGIVVAGLELPGAPKADSTFDSTPERAVAAIQELGPTFVKLGQVLSTRPDIMDASYCAAFRKLQDQASTLPFSDIEAQLNDGLGPGWRQAIDLDETPLATASMAQVHRGRLTTGEEVVLKVQRPGIERIITADLHILGLIARQLAAEYPEAQSFDPVGVLEEFDRSMRAELDFVQEARNMKRFSRHFADNPEVRIPTVFDDLTSPTVLCMEFLDGVRMREARAAGADMETVGVRYLRCVYDQLFLYGLFHGDLHPGNVMVLDGDVIGLLDFGMVGRMTQGMRDQVISIMFALQRGDFRTVARLFYDIAVKEDRVDYRTLERETVEVMEKHWSGGTFKDMQMGAYVMDLMQRAARQGCRIPTNYTMFFKAIMTAEGLTKSLIPEVDPIGAIEPYFRRMVQDRASWTNIEQELFYTAFSLQSLVSRLPVTLSQVLDDIDAQRISINVNTTIPPEVSRQADRRANRAILAGLTIGLLACGIAAWANQVGNTPNDVPLLGILLVVMAALCAVQLGLWMMRRS